MGNGDGGGMDISGIGCRGYKTGGQDELRMKGGMEVVVHYAFELFQHLVGDPGI